MPNYTSRLNIPLPLGNENVTRAAYITALNALESNASAVVDLSAHKTANPADHPAGSISDTLIGTRTVDQTQAPSAANTPSFVGLILSQLANRVKAASGTTNWSDAPPVSLSAINTALRFTGAATTTQAALTVTGALTVTSTTTLGGIVYTWPGSQTASYYLQTNGTGTLSWAAVPPGITVAGTAAQVLVNGGTAGVNSGTATLSLATSGTLPGNWTLSSPTFSGTVSGAPAWASGQTFPSVISQAGIYMPAGYPLYLNNPTNTRYLYFDGAEYQLVSAELLINGSWAVTETNTRTLSNKTLTTPTLSDPVFSPNSAGAMSGTSVFMYGSGTLNLPVPVDGHMKQVKAYGASVTVTNPNSASYGLFAPGSQSNVASFVINAGDSVSFYAVAGNWWAI